MTKHTDLLQEFGYFSQSARTVDALMEQIVQRLHVTMTRYNWAGFYLVDKADPRTLVLGPHAGSFEPRERVPLDQGLYATASGGTTAVLNNVADDPRHRAGSDLVKSELVAPVFVRKGGVPERLYGEIDINSYFVNTFTRQEQEFVEACAALVGSYLEQHV
jgi:L-methionine (R)-S-oxide reductase